MDSFQHGVEHFIEGSDRSRKFCLLHVDQSVELLVKERLVQAGKSIYKTDGKTLSFHEAFSSATKITLIPEHPRLEELHDLRNIVQHKGVVPDQTTTTFYVDSTYEFVKRFLQEEFAVSIHDFLSVPQIAVFEAPSRKTLPQQVADAIDHTAEGTDNTSKVLSLYTALEIAAQELVGAPSLNTSKKVSVKGAFRESAAAFGIESKRFNKEWKFIDILRGKIMHSDHVPSDNEVQGYVNTTTKVLSIVGFTLPDTLTSSAKLGHAT